MSLCPQIDLGARPVEDIGHRNKIAYGRSGTDILEEGWAHLVHAMGDHLLNGLEVRANILCALEAVPRNKTVLVPLGLVGEFFAENAFDERGLFRWVLEAIFGAVW